jgi:protoheme ferro-lyase
VLKKASSYFTVFIILMAAVYFVSCSSNQDIANYQKYLNQDTEIKGKAGILITALGQPEAYDYTFFDNYLNQIFNAAFPWYLKYIIMRDSGTVFRDPENLFAQESFKPKTLMDCFGNIKSPEGIPYAQLDVTWVKPRKKGDGGHFLLKQKNGYVDIAEKTAIKVAASYYGRMPGKRIPYIKQHKAIFKDLKKRFEKEFPQIPMKTAWAMYPDTVQKAIDELLRENVKTIVVCDLFPVYSNLEEFNALFVEIKHFVSGRAKIIYTPSVGAFASYRNVFVQMTRDEISQLPSDTKKLLVLTRHGFPEIKGEPYHELAPAFYKNLEKEVKAAVKGTGTDILVADTEFSGEDDDPDNTRMSSAEALEFGLAEKYNDIIFILVDFMTENTDTVYCAREEALEPLGFEYDGTVPYTDFSLPFRTEFKKESTRVVITGTPVGLKYRPLVVDGIYDAISTVLKGAKWPELVVQ